MSLFYRFAYRVGFTPWERAGREGGAQLAALLDREEADRGRPLGRALDLGCGTGSHTIGLAQRGWTATGVDAVDRAIEKARSRPGADQVRFLVGDVTALDRSGIDGDVDLFLDLGCFHGLTDDERAAEARGITALSTPTATLLLLSFVPGRRGPLPRGADRGELERTFPGWEVVSVDAADTSGMPGPMKSTAPQFFRLRRVS
jgi:SAM-dependent methyltransferase